MKDLFYKGTEKQLQDHHFIIQTETIKNDITRYAIRDFKKIDEAVSIVLSSNNPILINQKGLIRLIVNPRGNHRYLKREILDLIEDHLVEVKDDRA